MYFFTYECREVSLEISINGHLLQEREAGVLEHQEHIQVLVWITHGMKQ